MQGLMENRFTVAFDDWIDRTYTLGRTVVPGEPCRTHTV